jgi:spore coat polysaccharide biosynthesis protein SpsF (cytidylyltransferase family)
MTPPADQPRIVAVLIARMDSTRLRGKALMEIAGMPLISLVQRRLSQSRKIHAIALATTDRACDDPLADWAKREGVAVFRGEVDDVGGRVADCAASLGATHFVRVNGDSPFVDAQLIDQGVDIALATGADLVTNLLPRSYPYGVAVEILRLDTYRRALADFKPEEREHVTQHFYRNTDRYRVESLPVAQQPGLTTLRLTIDEPGDVAIIAALAERLDRRLLLAGHEEISRLARAAQGDLPH